MNKAFLVELKCFGKKFFQRLVKEVVRCPENFSARCIERTVRSEADDTGRRRDDISDHFCIAEQIQWDRAVLLGTPVFGYFLAMAWRVSMEQSTLLKTAANGQCISSAKRK